MPYVSLEAGFSKIIHEERSQAQAPAESYISADHDPCFWFILDLDRGPGNHNEQPNLPI
jgi:hypothetical protein